MQSLNSATAYGQLTSEEVTSAVCTRPIFLPIGAIEQHGPHLPLTVDVDIATAIAAELARRTDGLLTPSIPYGARSLPSSGGGLEFPGTIHVRGTVLIEYFADVLKGFVRTGARLIVLVNGHFENESLLFEAIDMCRELNQLARTQIIALSWWSAVSPHFLCELFAGDFVGWHAEHAGLCETSLMLYLHPELVRPERVNNEHPPLAGLYLHPVDVNKTSNRGVLSRTTGSSSEIGRKLFVHVCDALEAIVGKNQTL